MRIALRDDDTCYFTQPEELEQAFSDLGDFPVTLSVVPFATWKHGDTFPYGIHEEITNYMPLEANTALVAYLKGQIMAGKYEIALHGIHHAYRRNPSGIWESETVWCEKGALKEGLAHAKAYLEQLLNTKVSVFAAPSNAVTDACAKALDYADLHANCNYCRKFERSFSLRYLINYLKCNGFRLLTGRRYSGVLQEQGHREMAIFEFLDTEHMIRQLEVCQRFHMDLVIYTHYWNLNADPAKKKALAEFLQYAQEHGATPAHLSQCFE